MSCLSCQAYNDVNSYERSEDASTHGSHNEADDDDDDISASGVGLDPTA